MERVARENWRTWGDESEDAALTRILNDNSYNYREYYSNNPEETANASTHWPDTYKIYYHPTFSDESIYSGKVSEYNPMGAVGGHWLGNLYLPADTYHARMQSAHRFKKGGFMPSSDMQERIAQWEGASMRTNRSFESEAKGFVNALPTGVREQVLANPELADWLYSYSYNVGAGRFKERVVPALQRYYNGNGSVQDIQQSMWASGDKKLRGLAKRRERERQGVQDALWDTEMRRLNVQIANPSLTKTPYPAFQPLNEQAVAGAEYAQFPAYSTAAPAVSEMALPQEPFAEEGENPYQGLRTLMSIQESLNDSNGGTPQLRPLTYNEKAPYVARTFGEGGGIHIKPSHKGRLTELKKRTGKTEAELYNDGNLAHRKMVTFARNSRKWKHGDGGNLFVGGGDENNEGSTSPALADNPMHLNPHADNVLLAMYEPLPEVTVTPSTPGQMAKWARDYLTMSNDTTLNANLGRE